MLAVSGLVAGLAIAGTPQGNRSGGRTSRTSPVELKVGEGSVRLPIDSREVLPSSRPGWA